MDGPSRSARPFHDPGALVQMLRGRLPDHETEDRGPGRPCCGLPQLRSQVTLNPFPLLFSALGVASVAPDEVIMVISSSVNEEITPDVEPSVTVAPEKVTLLKS